MNRFRDIWYNINDIILVLFIVAASAAIIFWRVNVIFAYTDNMAKGSVAESKNKTASEIAPDDGEEEKKNPWLGAGTLREDMEITIAGNTSVDMVKKLEEERLFSSYADFQAACAQAGTSPENIKEGTYIFKEGTTKEAFITAIAPPAADDEEEPAGNNPEEEQPEEDENNNTEVQP